MRRSQREQAFDAYLVEDDANPARTGLTYAVMPSARIAAADARSATVPGG